MSDSSQSSVVALSCDGCRTDRGPFLKLSLGKDFFGRNYDRLSPSSDQRPQWYCPSCSMQKNLQRDVRDIRMELDKLVSGQPSQFADEELLQRARLRLHEIAEILEGQAEGFRLVSRDEVASLVDRLSASPIPMLPT